MDDYLKLIRKGMIDAGITNYKSLAKESGIDYQTLQRRIKNPENFKIYEIQALCKTLGINASDLIQCLIGGAA